MPKLGIQTRPTTRILHAQRRKLHTPAQDLVFSSSPQANDNLAFWNLGFRSDRVERLGEFRIPGKEGRKHAEAVELFI